MDGLGAIEPLDANKEIFTAGFGGCTSFYAKTQQVYGFYHLRSTMENKDNGFNENFKEWLHRLKSYYSENNPIHFELGTPCDSVREEPPGSIFDTHLALGMETYLKQLCKKNEIHRYTIHFIDMSNVKTVFANRQKDLNFLRTDIIDKPYYQGRSPNEDILYREALEFTRKALSGELTPIAENLKTTMNTTNISSQYKTQFMDLKIKEEEVNTNQRSGDCTIL
ncbi:hypothetical protein [Legionella saoudiensis]|uniref:hypothetical protein n=1 Tax=Legionella saoudiensis TaxID=1750561 RepID=UPI00122DD95F|nr:hypothetical protein [Legionella saoudiensis]